MKYAASIINQVCPECDGGKIAAALYRAGVLATSVIEHDYEVFLCFLHNLEEAHKSKIKKPTQWANAKTREKYKIDRFRLWRIKNRFL